MLDGFGRVVTTLRYSKEIVRSDVQVSARFEAWYQRKAEHLLARIANKWIELSLASSPSRLA